MKKRMIFASMVAATMIANVTAKAETVSTTTLDSNITKTTTEAGKLLVNGKEKELNNFINTQLPQLATTKEFAVIDRVLNIYNSNSSAFFNLTTAEKVEFNNAVVVFTKNLENNKTIDAKNWLNKVKYTANTINFLWSVNQIEVEDINIDTNIDAEVTAL
jgi:hypothetical protein